MNVPSPYSIVSFTFLCVCRKLNWSASQCWCSPTWHTSIENANSVETYHDLLCLEVCTQLFHLACSQFSMYEQTKYKSCLYRWGWNLPCFQALLLLVLGTRLWPCQLSVACNFSLVCVESLGTRPGQNIDLLFINRWYPVSQGKSLQVILVIYSETLYGCLQTTVLLLLN